MSNNLSINTRKVSANYREAREELKAVISSLVSQGLSWSNSLEIEDLIISTGTLVTLVPLLNSLFKFCIQKDGNTSFIEINIRLLKFSLTIFLLSNVIFNKSVISSIINLFNSSKSMLLIIPENLFIETEENIITKFNSIIEDSANVSKDSLSEIVSNILIDNIIKNETV